MPPQRLEDLPQDVGIRWERAGDEVEENMLALLSEAEHRRYSLISHPRTRVHFLLGRFALRRLLADRMRISPVDVQLEVEKEGSVVSPNSGLSVSIAHSGKWSVAAAAARHVGVDIEKIRPRSEGVLSFILHPSEHKAFHALPLGPEQRLIMYWSLKEAVLKALRTGFRRSPKRVKIEVKVEEGTGMAFLDDGQSFDLRFKEHEGYYTAVAYGARQKSLGSDAAFHV